MSEEKIDKLFEVMLEVKGTVDKLEIAVNELNTKVNRVENKAESLAKEQNEMNVKLDRIGDNIDLLAQKNWHNEKDIYRI